VSSNTHALTNLVSGTLRYRAGATINANARLDITGGTLDTTNQSLTINGGTLTHSGSAALSSGSALIVQGAAPRRSPASSTLATAAAPR
jgi:hypothetical protein